MSETEHAVATGFGVATIDIFREPGVVSPDYVEGAKINSWRPEDDAMAAELLDGGAEFHAGGNVLNVLAYLALKAGVDVEARMAGVLGRGDRVSEAVRNHFGLVGVEDDTLTRPGFLPGLSIIESRRDRMVRARPRPSLAPHLTPAYIERATAGSDIVVVSSLKDVDLTGRVLRHTPEGAFTSLNPSGSELVEPGALLETVSEARPHRLNLLALNNEELAVLVDGKEGDDVVEMAAEATEVADAVLCTLGAKGVLLVRRNGRGRVETTQFSPEPLPADSVVNTLGAGDRAHSQAIDGLYRGEDPEVIVRAVAHATRGVIQVQGAHADLYDKEAFLRHQQPTMDLPLRVAA